MKSNLEKYLFELRRIEEHRTEGVEKEIRKVYKKVLKELKNYIGDLFIEYSEDGILDYSTLYRAGLDARFLDEVDLQLDRISAEERRQIRELVQETYQKCYDGMKTAVEKAVGNMELVKESLSVIESARPEVIAAMVNNPVHGLTLNERLEKKRRDVIYNIRQEISVGISNGDRYETIANRVAGTLEGDYKKSIRIVRTEAHRAREQGNHDSAVNIDKALRQGHSGMIMTKTWKTMKDERVRPNRRYKTKKGWRNGKPGKYDHQKMDGICIPVEEEFELPSGAKTYAPGQSGVAGEDINCRCYLSYKLKKLEDLQLKNIENNDEDDIIKTELETYGIKGIPKLNPDKIDVSGYVFDEKHIITEREHGITREEAERFIKEADISLTRWNGKYINYYSPNGATYVDVENHIIRTSFGKSEFDLKTQKIREVAERYVQKRN